MKKKNVPVLRFPEFKGKWINRKAKEYFINSRKKGASDLPIYSVTLNKGLVPRESLNRKMQNDAKPEDNLYVEIGSLSYNMMRMWQGAIGIATEKCMVSPAYIVLNPSKISNAQFFLYFFDRLRSLYLFTSYSYGLTSDRLRLYFKDFADIEFKAPSLNEQQKIVNFLTAIDEKIQQLTQKKTLLEAYKKGVMQKIFNQEIRFKNEKGKSFPDWERKTLGDICKITTGKLDANAMKKNGKYRFYTCAKNYFQIDNYAFDTEALLISGNGANVGYIHYYKGKFNAYQRTYVLDSFSEYIFYAFHFLNSFLKKRINSEKKEGNTPYIVLGTLRDMNIKLPSLEEQKKIANFLTLINCKIEKIEKEYLEMKVFKKGLLQKMFV